MSYIHVPDIPQDIKLGKPIIRLVGEDGNVFNLLGICRSAMKRYQEVDPSYNAVMNYDEMFKEVEQGDFENALRVMMGWLHVR